MPVHLLREDQHESMIGVLAEIHAYYNDGAVISREVVREHLLGNLLSPGSPHRLVVFSQADGSVLGFAAITFVYSLVDFAPESRRHCQLKELYVRSSMRSNGVGRALMSWVARHAVENGCHRIDWPVKATNAKGIAFYESIGAEQVIERLSFRLSEPEVSTLAFQHPEPSVASRPRNGSSMVLELRRAQPRDFPALQQMLELYQYELSDIWPQEADQEAKYGYDLERYRLGQRFHAHVAVEGTQYVGFALVAPALVTRKEGHWMEQFFIVKRFRRSGAGNALALHAFRSHPGEWEVGQMPANVVAQAFWRSVIRKATSGAVVELQVTEGWWQGTAQQFHVSAVT